LRRSHHLILVPPDVQRSSRFQKGCYKALWQWNQSVELRSMALVGIARALSAGGVGAGRVHVFALPCVLDLYPSTVRAVTAARLRLSHPSRRDMRKGRTGQLVQTPKVSPLVSMNCGVDPGHSVRFAKRTPQTRARATLNEAGTTLSPLAVKKCAPVHQSATAIGRFPRLDSGAQSSPTSSAAPTAKDVARPRSPR
jgi:hypothetical protein